MLEAMDAAGVDTIVSSPNVLGELFELESSEAGELLQFLNEEAARIQREHPGRIVGLAMLPMNDVETAVDLLDDAVLRLGLGGVCIPSNIGGGPVATDERLAIYERIEAHGIPVFLHPAHRSVAADAIDWKTDVGLGWLWETSAAAMSLIYSGTLDRCPGLQIVHPHLGGVIPYLLGRIESLEEEDDSPSTDRSISEYFRQNFYADSVGRTPGAIRLAVQTYGFDRVVFGSDIPWWNLAAGIRYVRDELGADAEAMMTRNRVPMAVS